jgi:hypothetical protein
MGRYDEVDARIATLAARQHQLVHRCQMYEAGLRRGALRSRVERGYYVEYRPGVFALAGAEATPRQRIMGAVLAAGPTAFASHVCSLYLHGLVEIESASVPLEATVVLERRPKVPGVRVHRSGLLVEHDITNVTGIPVASVERTIVDLSSRRTAAALGRLLDEAIRRRLTSLGRVVRCTARLPRAPGRSPKTLAEVLDPRLAGTTARESLLEDFVYDSIRRFGLPLPVCQHPIEVDGRCYRVDLCYTQERVVLEVDGFEYHNGRAVFDRDRTRGNEIALAGYLVLRITATFTDWQIATTVATALRLNRPARPNRELTFAAWQSVWS